MKTISACIVAWNNEAEIERCLRSLEGVVDEIILVHDGPCSDRTLEIAERYGCRVVVAEHVGEAEPHRPLSFALATGEWILRIDADEFLSDELREHMRTLAARDDVDGWDFVWPIWNPDRGRYVTQNGPYKMILTRRSASIRSGIPHDRTRVRGRKVRLPYVLEHRPLYDNYRLATVMTRWRRWARIHAQIYLMDWQDLPQFGYPPDADWPARRKWGNHLAPLLVVPYGLADFVLGIWWLRRMRPIRQVVKIALLWGLYAMIVQLYVVKFRYLDRAGARPAGVARAE